MGKAKRAARQRPDLNDAPPPGQFDAPPPGRFRSQTVLPRFGLPSDPELRPDVPLSGQIPVTPFAGPAPVYYHQPAPVHTEQAPEQAPDAIPSQDLPRCDDLTWDTALSPIVPDDQISALPDVVPVQEFAPSSTLLEPVGTPASSSCDRLDGMTLWAGTPPDSRLGELETDFEMDEIPPKMSI